MRVIALAAAWASALAAPCPGLANQLASTHGAAQVVTVESAGLGTTSATLTLWERSHGCWRRTAGPWTARLGRSGLSDHKREGDGATPTGAYSLGTAFYGVAPDPGVHGRYHRLVCGDWWDEDPRSPAYNTFQHVACGTRPSFGGGSEALWRITPQYRYFAVIGYNARPAVAGAGSAIFLHVSTGHATLGCISLPEPELLRLLRRLRASASPLIVIGTSAEIRRF